MNRPLPLLTDSNQFFWTSGADGQLRFLRCGSCRTWNHPPQPTCRACGSDDVAPEAVSGRASVLGFTVNHQPWHPAFEPPYVIAVVAMDDAPEVRLTTNLIDVDHDALAIGMAVDVTFEAVDDVWLPLFTPAEGDR